MIGLTIAGRYRVDAQIGVGGMGIVYRAHDLTLERDVALKVIAPFLMQQESARRRFMREAKALAGLTHPNIVTVHDLVEDEENGAICIVMELLHGKCLRDCMGQPNRPSVFDVAEQICRALECAHSRGVLHRDIKPENIFVCNDGTLKLMDFGLARLFEAVTAHKSSIIVGTVAYMAPEQLRGEKQDSRTDLYALGVLIYEYLTGAPPFSGDNPGAILVKHLTESPRPLRESLPTLPPEVETIVMRLLAKDPAKRYPSGTIVREALERIEAGVNASQALAVSQPVYTPTLMVPVVPPLAVPSPAPVAVAAQQTPNPKRAQPLPTRPRPPFATLALAAVCLLTVFSTTRVVNSPSQPTRENHEMMYLGADNWTRLLVTQKDGMALVTVNPQGAVVSRASLGRRSGWHIQNLSVGYDGATRLFWTHQDGRKRLDTITPQGQTTSASL